MAGTRLPRLLELLVILHSRTAQRTRALAERMGVSERTVYRDLEALSRAKIPVHFDKDRGGYRVSAGYFLPPIQLTLGEAMALSVLGSEMAGKGQPPFLQEAWQAITKIRSQLPATVMDEVEAIDGHVRVRAAQASPQDGCAAHFEMLRKAIAKRRKVRCSYEGGKRDGPFLFRPYSLFFAKRAWYVIGHNERRNAERSLKLNRLREVHSTEFPYGIPDGWSLDGTFGRAGA
jgi:predicted DNA-binding transcriptional regulator YafY